MNWLWWRRRKTANRPHEGVTTSYLGAHAEAWLSHPDGGLAFTGQRDGILDHDPECESLSYAWLPKNGGRTCLSDISSCEGCGLYFAVEGLYGSSFECEHSYHEYCQCCRPESDECTCTPDGTEDFR